MCIRDSYLPEEPRLDHLAIAILIRFAFMPPAGRTPLEAVSLLEYGASLQWSSGRGFRSKRWWYPPRGELPAGARFAEHAVELRSMLLDGLERSLDKAGRNLLTLSGGFDSSALAWAAGDALGREFSTLNLAPRGGPELLEMRSQVDRIFADLGPRVRRRWERELSPEARLEYLRDAPRVVWPVVHPALCVLPAIAAETKLLCMFGGEGCDEQLGGGPALTDWASSASLATAARRFPAAFSRTAAIGYWGRVRARRILHRSGLKSSLAPPSFLAPALRAEYLENARQEQGAFSRDGSERPYLSHRVHHSAAATVQNWEVCSALGLRRYFPFFNRDVLELAYRCDPTELTGQHPKRLVRAAVRGIAPDYLFDVQKLRWHDPPVRLPWTDRLPEELAGIVREDWLEHPPSSLDAQDALRLRALLNIILAVRTCRIEQRESSHVERA